MEDFSMEEEIHPADEEDEALLNEASECGTSPQDKREETKDRASGAKRTLELYTPNQAVTPKTAKTQRGGGKTQRFIRCTSHQGTQP